MALYSNTTITRSNVTAKLAATLPYQVKERADNFIHNETVLISLLRSKGRLKPVAGDSVILPVRVGVSPTIASDDGTGQSVSAEYNGSTNAVFPLIVKHTNLTIPDVYMEQNKGDSRVFDYAQAQTDDILQALFNDIEDNLWNVGSATSSVIWGVKDITGTVAAGAHADGASTDGYGPESYAGIARADLANWCGRMLNSNGLATLVGDLETLTNNITGGTQQKPSIIITDEKGASLYAAKAGANMTLTERLIGDTSFPSYEFRGIPVIYSPVMTVGIQDDVDTPVVGAADTGSTHRFYCLNADTLTMYTGLNWNFDKMLGDPVHIADYMKTLWPVRWMGQLVCDKPHRNGVLRNVPNS